MRLAATVLLLVCCVVVFRGAKFVPATPADSDAVCARCHRQIYDSWKHTPMANASGPAVEGVIPADFIHTASGVHYRIALRDGQVWLSYERPNASPGRELRGEQQLRFFLGSGRRGRTWIFEREGYWFEIPINWYAKKHLWDMTPNFLHAREMPFTLPVDPGCLRCHASGVRDSLPDARNHFSGDPFPRGGITCEACHGDPSQHLAQNGHGPILNPEKLDSQKRDSVCLACHLEGEVAVVRRGQRLNAFQPGDDLFKYAVFFEHSGGAGAAARATSQWDALLQSACKRNSGDRLTCTTCHSSHTSPPPEERVSFYRSRCLACHSEARFVSKHHPENPDCVSCHMPRRETEDIAHEQLTDHRIQIASKTFSGTSVSDELIAIGGVQAGPRDRGIAWAQFALRGDRTAGEQALRLLRKAEGSDPGQISDTELHTELGFLEQARGNGERARLEYEAALRADPLNGTAAGDLAILDFQQGSFESAVNLWQGVFSHDPGATAAGMNLAVAQCRLGRRDAAEQTLRRVLLFAPDNGAAKDFLMALVGGTVTCQHR
jgi:tetratricopeptide (TPR) repeat protein